MDHWITLQDVACNLINNEQTSSVYGLDVTFDVEATTVLFWVNFSFFFFSISAKNTDLASTVQFSSVTAM